MEPTLESHELDVLKYLDSGKTLESDTPGLHEMFWIGVGKLEKLKMIDFCSYPDGHAEWFLTDLGRWVLKNQK